MTSLNSKAWIHSVYQTHRLKNNQLVTMNPRTLVAKAKLTTPWLKTGSLTFWSLKMALYSTNPYNNFQAANSKEYIPLDKGAKQDFRPETRFDIIPGNSNLFSAAINKCAALFGYGALLNVPSDRTADTTDSNTIAYNNHIHMIKTWNKITDEIIAKNANKVWGTQDWTISTTKDELSVTRGEVRTATTLTKSGKKKFMECWKSTILAYHVMALLTPEGQASIKLQEKAYQWTDPLSDKIVLDGRSLLNETLKLMCPDVQTNVYAELAEIKAICRLC